MRSALCLIALALVTGSMPAMAMEPTSEKPFGIPRERIAASVRKVGMLPVNMPANVPNRVEVARRLEAAIEAQMRAGGFDILPAALMRDIRDDLAESLAPLYDPINGRSIEKTQKSLDEYARDQYETTNEVDVWLRPAVVPRKVVIAGGQYSWDGAVEPVGQNLPKGADADATLAGLSLRIELLDNNGRALYLKYGALQPTRVMHASGGRVRPVAVDPAHLLEDPERDRRALLIALQPLAAGGDSPAPGKLPPVAPVPVVADPDTLKLPRSDLLSGYARVALLPLSLAEGSLQPAVIPRYRELLDARLKAAGFEVVDAADAGAALERLRRSAPGFFDPLTGAFNEARWNTARSAILKEQGQRLRVQAFVDPGIVTDPALSLGVRITDLEGRELFEDQAELSG
jgi:hypothetical protein